MEKTFCIAVPIRTEDNYFLPLRMNKAELMGLIHQKKYFILHAPRQSGKTTAMRLLVDELNASGKYEALYVNVEQAQIARDDYERGMAIILDKIDTAMVSTIGENHPAYGFFSSETAHKNLTPGTELARCLRYWAMHSAKPTIFFIDEIDSLMGDTLISVLRQLRTGYADRPKEFPQSLCLIGLRDVRDYRISSKIEGQIVMGGSAFNIKAESLTINNFSLQEVRDLYLQHTAATGQQFTDEAITYAFEQTQGQPWLVNALAYQACFRDVLDRSEPITLDVMKRSRETLILRRDTHIDQLTHKLQEKRVRLVIDAIVAGVNLPDNLPSDDLQYVHDLGLVNQNVNPMKVANPIYQEVILRELTNIRQKSIFQEPASFLNPDKTLNMTKLMNDWIDFYRENAAIWFEQNEYKESAAHLLKMAYLQRVINGGGSLHREYALGRGRVDLIIEFGTTQRIVIELKIMRGPKTLPQGLEQTAWYMDVANATEGHLVIFDLAEKKSWGKKMFKRTAVVDGKTIHVWGM